MICCLLELGLNTRLSFAPFLVASIIRRKILKQASSMKERADNYRVERLQLNGSMLASYQPSPWGETGRSLDKNRDLAVATAHC